MMLVWGVPFLLSVVISAGSVHFLIGRSGEWGLMDEANDRSLHTGVKPRSGGVGVLLSIACAWLLIAKLGFLPPYAFSILIACLAIAGISLLDDFKDVPALPRFATHFAAAIVAVLSGYALDAINMPGFNMPLGPVLGSAATIVFVVWFINLYNFMDGMDGFAGGMTFFGFGLFALLGILEGDPQFASFCSAIAGAALGFLIFNFPPSRVFMGDAGAATLGFLAAAVILVADSIGVAPLWVGVMIFAPFFLDATVTLCRRVLLRERIWEAHRTHYYQRLVQVGWSHRRAVLLEYGLMLGCGGTALLIADKGAVIQWIMILLWLSVFLLCAFYVRKTEKERPDARD